MDKEGIKVGIRNKDGAAFNLAYQNPNIQGISCICPQQFEQKDDEMMIDLDFNDQISNFSMGSIHRNETFFKREIDNSPKFFDPNDVFHDHNNQRRETLFRRD